MYSAISANKRNTVLIMAAFVGLVAAVGWLISQMFYGGNMSITIAVMIGALVYALIQYFAAGKLAVAATGAKEIKKADNPRLYRIVENLSITLGMPMPKVYVMDDPAPNAFATGRDPEHAIVAATTGLMDIMTDAELEGVMAHEMGHVKNYDIRVSMIAFGVVAAIAVLADFARNMMFFGSGNRDNSPHPAVLIIGVVAIILAPVIATMIQMAVSRQREYLADASGALTTRHPEALASALEKIGQYGKPMKKQSTATAHMFFSNPLSKTSLSAMFSTHPPVEKRVERLRDNAEKF